MQTYLFEAPLEIKKEARKIYKNFEEKMEKIGLNARDSLEQEEWDVYETKFFDVLEFDLKTFKVFMDKNGESKDSKSIETLLEYNEYIRKKRNAKSVSTKVHYEPDNPLLNIFHFWADFAEGERDFEEQKEFFKKKGYEKEVSEIELKKLFSKEEAEICISKLEELVDEQANRCAENIEKILLPLVNDLVKEAQEKMNKLEIKVNNW